MNRLLSCTFLLAAALPVVAAADARVESFRPVQGAQIFYVSGTNVAIQPAFQQHGLLTVLGRNDLDIQGQAQANQNGAILAAYIDPLLQDCGSEQPSDWDTSQQPYKCKSPIYPIGKYQQLLMLDSACGPAIPQWSGVQSYPYGVGADVRVSWFPSKLLCVVQRMKADNPNLRAIFLDDYGPGWTGYKNAGWNVECDAYAPLHTAFDQLKANVDLLFFVNGTWHKTETCGGGWPNASLNGLGGAIPVYEHHPTDPSSQSFADAYFGASTSQWLKDNRSNVDANGNRYPGALFITGTSDETAVWSAKPYVAWVAQQTTYTTYDPQRTPLFPGHSIGVTNGPLYGHGAWQGPSSTGQSADRLRATKISVASAGKLRNAAIYLDGQGGTAGTQAVRMALYADNHGVPGALVAAGSQFPVVSGSGPEWYVSDFDGTPITAGTYWLVEFTGGTQGVSRNHGDTTVSNYLSASAPYANGAPSTFPPNPSVGSIYMDVFLTVE